MIHVKILFIREAAGGCMFCVSPHFPQNLYSRGGVKFARTHSATYTQAQNKLELSFKFSIN